MRQSQDLASVLATSVSQHSHIYIMSQKKVYHKYVHFRRFRVDFLVYLFVIALVLIVLLLLYKSLKMDISYDKLFSGTPFITEPGRPGDL